MCTCPTFVWGTVLIHFPSYTYELLNFTYLITNYTVFYLNNLCFDIAYLILMYKADVLTSWLNKCFLDPSQYN
jgi:hypothetical protein